MSIPLLGFVPGWIILLVALAIIAYFFGRKGLHFIAIVFIIWLAWYLFRGYF
ncbi:MAG TPA: hypothetical protein VI953_02610 [Candidatus Paceibacterota bacterium]